MEKEALLRKLRDSGQRELVASDWLRQAIAHQVKSLRDSRQSMTQKDLAVLAGLDQPAISALENARNRNPELQTLMKLARAFDVRLRVTLETFGSLTTYAWSPPPPPALDPRLQTPVPDPAADKLRQDLADLDYRHEYAEAALFMDLGSQILAIRRQRGLAQDDLSDRSGVIQKIVSQLETQDAPNPTLETLCKVAFTLSVRLHVEFVSFATLMDALTGITSESLRRPEPTHDPVLYPPAATAVRPDPKVPQRTRWMQDLIIPWLQDEGLGVPSLLRWLGGYDLPPVGHDDEPHQWILRGIPAGQPRLERKFAERLSVILAEAPDSSPITPDQDDAFLVNLYRVCAGLHYPGALAEPLWEAYERLSDTAPSGAVRDALQAAITNNQFGDKPLKHIWLPMLEKAKHSRLRGNELAGYEGVLARRLDGLPAPIVTGLNSIVGRWNGSPVDVRVLKRLLSRTPFDLNEARELRTLAAGWPPWAQQTLPQIEQTEKDGVFHIRVDLTEGPVEGKWEPGTSPVYRVAGHEQSSGGLVFAKKRSFLNYLLIIVSELTKASDQYQYHLMFEETLAAK